jgi:aryl-alcohol dehydrogenase-like predicted oxidoreductase
MVVSEVGLGGGYITGKDNRSPDEIAVSIVRRALELGCNYIDTAPVYGSYRSETCIGLALKDWKRPCYIATKVGSYPNGLGSSPQPARSHRLRRICECRMQAPCYLNWWQP